MKADICSYFDKHPLREQTHILVAVSGGADSVALLHCLYTLKDTLGFALSAAHVHHGIRGEEAWRDLRCVEELCQDLRVPLHVAFADVPKEAAATGESLEQCARRLRYDCLRRLAAKRQALIATAHTANDQAETLLLHLLRGSGLDGLTGIWPENQGVIRPILEVSRQQVEAYIEENELSYVTDSTNTQDVHPRNRLRLRVLPELTAMNPSLLTATSRMARHLAEDRAYLEMETCKAFARLRREQGLDAEPLAALPAALRHRVLLKWGAEYGLSLEDRHIQGLDALLAGRNGGVSLPKGRVAVVNQKKILCFFSPQTPQSPVTYLLNPGQNLDFLGKKISISFINMEEVYKDGVVNKKLFIKTIDYDKIHGEIRARNRREGDTIALAGRGGTKTLKKLFNEGKIEPEARMRLAVLADDDGVFFVEGFGPDRRVSVDPGTVHPVVVSIVREGER